MNANSMIQYVQYYVDHILSLLKGPSGKYSPIWNVENPFPWMDMISIDSKTNFSKKEQQSINYRVLVSPKFQRILHCRKIFNRKCMD